MRKVDLSVCVGWGTVESVMSCFEGSVTNPAEVSTLLHLSHVGVIVLFMHRINGKWEGFV